MIRLACSALLLCAPLAAAAPCPVHASWPTGDWPRALVDTTSRAAEIKALEDFAFTLTGQDAERLGLRTDGLIIVKRGTIIYERYARGWDETGRHISWSVAKSFTSSLAGVAVQQGALSIDDSICTYLTEYEGKEVCKITLKNAITFTTGIAWQEIYEKDPYQLSSEINSFLGEGHRDQLRFLLEHRIAAPPGEKWLYSSGDAQLASVVVKRALQKKTGDANPFWTYLFDKIGASDAVFEEDAKGTPLGGSMLFMTPREYAKFGYFALNDGCWAGERILPEGWMQTATSVSDGFRDHASSNNKTPTGYAWWLNKPVPSRGLEKPWKDAPDDAYIADGHWGQYIAVLPSDDIVIVRTGDDRDSDMDINELIKLSMAVAR